LSIVKIRFCYPVGLLSPGLGAVAKNAVVWGDRGFESISVQRRVWSKPVPPSSLVWVSPDEGTPSAAIGVVGLAEQQDNNQRDEER
jgi:hypothetical protein